MEIREMIIKIIGNDLNIRKLLNGFISLFKKFSSIYPHHGESAYLEMQNAISKLTNRITELETRLSVSFKTNQIKQTIYINYINSGKNKL